MQTVDVTVYYVEMFTPPVRSIVAPRTDLSVVHVPAPSIGWYRDLYKAVGEDYNWTSRKKLTDAALTAIIHDPLVELHVLRVGDAVAGFSELDLRQAGQIEIVQFGLRPDFIGQGLGKWFLDRTVDDCWSRQPDRVWLHTCTLDHPAALPNYERAGFRLYKTEVVQR